MVFCDDYVQFSGICSSGFFVKNRNVNRKKNAVVILGCFRTKSRRDKFLDCKRMDVEMLLKIHDVISAWIGKIKPSNFFECYFFHEILYELRIRTNIRIIGFFCLFLLSNEVSETKTCFRFRASDDNKEVNTPEPEGSRACPGVNTDLFFSKNFTNVRNTNLNFVVSCSWLVVG